MAMSKDADTIFQHHPVLSIVASDQQRCERVLEVIAHLLAEKSIDILAVYPRKQRLAGEIISTTTGMVYDTVFLDHEDKADLEIEGWSERTMNILSQHFLSYDLVIFCKTDNECSEEIQIVEGTDSSATLFRYKADDDFANFAVDIYDWLLKQLLAKPVWGCVLIGGRSSRMGQPKHLIKDAEGITWGEKIVTALSSVTEKVVLSGVGEIPPSLTHLERLVDIPDAQGPLAGIVAALRWNPHVSFIVSACDMPGIAGDSLSWLLGRRRPGVWGTVPLHPQTQRLEPLFAHYDNRSRVLFERLLQSGSLRPNHVCKAEKIETPVVPPNFAGSWRNCNTPADLAAL
jgi:molybdopterin-guanine dinucleotide biosynthesis protein A